MILSYAIRYLMETQSKEKPEYTWFMAYNNSYIIHNWYLVLIAFSYLWSVISKISIQSIGSHVLEQIYYKAKYVTYFSKNMATSSISAGKLFIYISFSILI